MKAARSCRIGTAWAAAIFAAAVFACPAQAQTGQTKKPAAQRGATAASQGSDYWSVNSSLGSQYDRPRSRATERRQTPEITTEMTSEFGRIPVQSGGTGSIGITSGSSVSSGRFSDGREVPGLNPNTQKESSFVGVGLRVQSGSKGLPVPLPTPWNRVE